MKQKRGRRQEKKETWRQEIRGWYGKPSQFNTTSFRPVPNAARWEAELAWVSGLPMGEGGGGEEKFLSFASLPFSLPSFPFSPETPDTQAKAELDESARPIEFREGLQIK